MTKRKQKKRARRKPTAAERADRLRLYEDTVQNPEADIDFVDAEFRRLTGRRAQILREDFCGSAKTCCEWVQRRRDNQATGVDLDPEVLEWARAHNVADLRPAQRDRVALIEGDVAKIVTLPQDVVLAMNFSYWVFTERHQLRRYFRRVRSALVDDGVLFLDCFGGADAYRVGSEKREGEGYTYFWETASYNAFDARVKCHIHFRFDDGSRMRHAFTYDWRLWTIPEIREVLREAGFGKVTVYAQGWDENEEEGDGEFVPVEEIEPDSVWICYIAAQAS